MAAVVSSREGGASNGGIVRFATAACKDDVIGARAQDPGYVAAGLMLVLYLMRRRKRKLTK